MENKTQHPYTLRSGSRSRSQTPSVQPKATPQLEPERHYDLRSRSRERSGTPAEISSSSRRSTSRPSSTVKNQEQCMETIAEKKEENMQEVEVDNQSECSLHEPTPSGKKPERRSERQRAKRQIFANGQNEARADSSSVKEDRKRSSVSPRRILTSDYSSEEGERDDPPSRPGSAYEIYKKAGEWWNVFPKTDYTYSERSQCRYEIAPGVLAMPNMSRRPIHSDCSSTFSSVPSTSQQNLSQFSQTESGLGDTMDITDSKERGASQSRTSLDETYTLSDRKSRSRESIQRSTVYKKTHVEQYTSHREVIYSEPGDFVDVRQRHSRVGTPVRSSDSRRYRLITQVDSDTELDEAVAVSTRTSGQSWRIVRWYSSILTVLHLWYSRTLEFLNLKTPGRRDYSYTYGYDRYQESRWSRLWRQANHILQYVYLLPVQILLLDSWLLSRMSGPRKWLRDRPSKLLWLALLPLLLLAGCFCLLHLPTFMPERLKAEPSFLEAFLADNKNLDESELTSIVRSLTQRIRKLESEATQQTERLSNVSRQLEESKGNDVLQAYDRKVTLLEKGLNEEEPSAASDSRGIQALRFELVTLRELYSQLRSCCDSCANPMTNEYVDKRIEEIVSGYLGPGVSKADFSKIVQSMLLTGTNGKIIQEGSGVPGIIGATENRVREIVKEALRIYDADKTGRVDYALESAGGQIISTRCTQRYDVKTRAIKFLAFMLYHENNNPRTVIQGNPIQPGACWAFQGFPGYLLIKLRGFVHVTGFTLEHASKSILPNGEMKSAPRKFSVWGYTDENDPNPVQFGEYEFEASDENLQYFPVQNTDITTPYEYVELRVQSNHGQLDYTCLYRFRVHGVAA